MSNTIELKLVVPEGWYDDCAFSELIEGAAKGAIKTWVRSEVFKILEANVEHRKAIEILLDSGYVDKA